MKSSFFILIPALVLCFSPAQARQSPPPLYDKPVHLGDSSNTLKNNDNQKKVSSQKTPQVNPKGSENKSPKKTKKGSGRLWQYKRTHFNQYSVGDEIQIGERFMKEQIEVFKKKKLAVNPESFKKHQARIEAIAKRLAAVSDDPHLPYAVTIFEKQDVANAYCLPGGKIGVFTGLFDPQKGLIDLHNDNEIAAVLAHEIAHATMHHVTRRLTTYNSLGLVGNLLSIGLSQGVGENWGYLADQVFSTGTFLYLPSYSRKHEKEADQVGYYYLAKAGFDPQAAIAVWERAAGKARDKGKGGKTNFFDSHPASGERAEFLKGFYNDAIEVQRQQAIMKKMRE